MLLAIDTSTAQVGVALFDGTRPAMEATWSSGVHHTVQLAPGVVDLLRGAGAAIDDVVAIGVAIGPGSFTALRVGMAFAKGLAVARQLPILGIPTLDVLAAAQPASGLPLAAVLQAGRARIAVGWYSFSKMDGADTGDRPSEREGHWVAVAAPQVMTVDGLAKAIAKPSIVAGELTAEERQRLGRKRVNVVLAPPNRCVRRPAVLAEMAWQRYAAGGADDAATLVPIYLHAGEPIAA